MALAKVNFEPTITIEFEYYENKQMFKHSTEIIKGRVYNITTFDDHWDSGMGKVIDIDYNNLIITMDCSEKYSACIKKFKLQAISEVYEVRNGNIIKDGLLE